MTTIIVPLKCEDRRRSPRLQLFEECADLFSYSASDPVGDTRVIDNYKRPDVFAKGDDIVYLKLHKLTAWQKRLLDDCATLAMQDQLVRNCYWNWQEWSLVKIEKAFLEEAVCLGVDGSLYHITFQAQNKYHNVITFEAQVWDSMDQRRVSCVRGVRPCKTDWQPGNFWIPLE